MPLAETLLASVAKTVVERAIRSAGLDAKARKALGRDPVQLAFKRALGRAFADLEAQHPNWTAALFDLSFFEREGADVLALFLTRQGRPEASDLAVRWTRSLTSAPGHEETVQARELEPVAARFLERLGTELSAEPALSEIHDARAIEGAAEDISVLRQRLAGERATAGTQWDYLFWLWARTAYLDPRGIPQAQRQVQLKLDEVYVGLRGHIESALAGAVDKPVPNPALPLSGGFELDTLGAGMDESTDDSELDEIVTRQAHLVILGDPGGGKTTLLRYLAHIGAAAGLEEVTRSASVPLRMPILVRISEYAQEDVWRTQSLSEFLPAYHRIHECTTGGLDDLLASALEAGTCTVLLDGLDEVVLADDRRGVVGRIEDFVRRYSEQGNRFVVTSRVAGYREAPLLDPFTHYRILDMNADQVERFLRRWCPAVEDSQTPELPLEQRQAKADEEIEGIMSAIRAVPGVANLARNPLLLTTLALIRRAGAQLPHKRVELYKLAANTLARTWRVAQGVPESALVEDAYLTRVLRRTAYWLHLERPTGIATDDDVREIMGEEWARIRSLDWDAEEPNPDIVIEVDKFLTTVRVQTGLFVERGPEQYGFMHLTFEEYYAARHLVAKVRSAPRLIRERLHDQRWDEPILLAIGFIGLDFPEQSSELVEGAVLAQGEIAESEQFAQSRYEEYLARDFLFALRCLGDHIPVEAALRERLVRRLIAELLDDTGLGRFDSIRRELLSRLAGLSGLESGNHALALLEERSLNDAVDVARVAAAEIALGLDAESQPAFLSLTALLKTDASEAAMAVLMRMMDRSSIAEAVREAVGLVDDPVPNEAFALIAAGGSSQAALRTLAEEFKSDGAPRMVARLFALPASAVVAETWDVYLKTVSDPVPPALLRIEDLSAEFPELRASLARVSPAHREDAARFGLLTMSMDQIDALDQRGLRRVIDSLDDASPDDQRHLAFIFTRLASKFPVDGVALAENMVADPSEVVREAAWYFLLQSGRVSPSEFESRLRQGERTQTRVTELGAAMSRDENLAAIVLRLWAEGAPDRATLARVLLSRADPAPSAAIVREMATDPDSEVRIAVADATTRLHGLGLLQFVQELQSDPEPQVRLAAAEAWRYWPSPPEEVHRDLVRGLCDEDVEVRRKCVITLAASGNPPPSETAGFESALRDAMDAESWTAREQAAIVLGDVGTASPQTLETLWAGLRDSDNDARQASVRALVQLATRWPDSAVSIEEGLIAALSDPAFDEPDIIQGMTGHDYALDGLRMLVSSERARSSIMSG